jgi:preprotein translocase subunit SecE
MMATRSAMTHGDDQPFKKPKIFEGVINAWDNATGFLRDVRGEMRKVVTPSRKELRVTTSVVIVAVFLFGLYFFVVDAIFRVAIHGLLGRLGGLQQ